MNNKLEEEIEALSHETELMDLETLIIDGTNARIPVELEIPIYNDGELVYKTYGALIKPLTSNELNNATQLGLKDDATDVNTEIVKLGLCKKDGTLYNEEIVEKLPAGVINALTEKILDASGVKQDKEQNTEFLRELMGF